VLRGHKVSIEVSPAKAQRRKGRLEWFSLRLCAFAGNIS
jgi:hypothetical protein